MALTRRNLLLAGSSLIAAPFVVRADTLMSVVKPKSVEVKPFYHYMETDILDFEDNGNDVRNVLAFAVNGLPVFLVNEEHCTFHYKGRRIPILGRIKDYDDNETLSLQLKSNRLLVRTNTYPLR